MTHSIFRDLRAEEHLLDPEQFAASAISAGTGLVVMSLGIEDINANEVQTGVRELAGLSFGNVAYTVPFRGSIVGIGVNTSSNKTAGTLTVEVLIDGITSGASVAVPNATDRATFSWAKGKFPFSAGVELNIQATADSGLLPANLYFIADVYTYLDQSTLS
jgi:hypothetical protein